MSEQYYNAVREAVARHLNDPGHAFHNFYPAMEPNINRPPGWISKKCKDIRKSAKRLGLSDEHLDNLEKEYDL